MDVAGQHALRERSAVVCQSVRQWDEVYNESGTYIYIIINTNVLYIPLCLSFVTPFMS